MSSHLIRILRFPSASPKPWETYKIFQWLRVSINYNDTRREIRIQMQTHNVLFIIYMWVTYTNQRQFDNSFCTEMQRWPARKVSWEKLLQRLTWKITKQRALLIAKVSFNPSATRSSWDFTDAQLIYGGFAPSEVGLLPLWVFHL